ncbi:hypothetical protein Tco_0310848, partial [Tanacetum coccineum]
TPLWLRRGDDGGGVAGLSWDSSRRGGGNGVWSGGDGGMTAASSGGGVMVTTAAAPEEGWRRVEARGYGDRVDRSGGSIFGIGRKSHRKSFPVAGDGGGGAVVVAGQIWGEEREW